MEKVENWMTGQSLRWSCCGAWEGGTITALAISPAFDTDLVILAATAAGLYRSIDGGQQWQRSARGLSDPRLTAVVFAPQPSHLAFAATADGRLFQSEDGGERWQECLGWTGLGLINALSVSPHFAADRTLFVATMEGIFRSQDGGISWESSTFGLLDLEILCLACAPTFAESEVLWAGSALGGFYRSRNGARSWRDAGLGLPDMAVQCIAVSPTYAQDQTLYVGTERDGIYRSTDGAATWHALSPDLTGQTINALAISSDGRTLFAGTGAGVYVSSDGGQQWSLPAGGAFSALALAVAADGTTVAGAYQEGILIWSSTHRHWQPARGGLTAHAPPMMLWDETKTFTLLDLDGALVQSTDEGRTWHLLNGDLDDEAVLAMAQATTDQGATLYVATATACYVQQAATWQTLALPKDVAPPTLLAIAADFAHFPNLLLADVEGHLFLRAGDQPQWQALAVPWGASQLLHVAFAPVAPIQQPVVALTVQPHPQQHYLLQLWQSHNLGATWRVLADFYADTPAAVMTLPLDPVEQPILVGLHNRLIKIYQTAGDTWAVQQHFLERDRRITGIVTMPDYIETPTIYVTTNDGLRQSTDGGATWLAVGEGLVGRTLVAFCPGQGAQPSYVVELGGAIWRQSNSLQIAPRRDTN